jgi:hypothetical protein
MNMFRSADGTARTGRIAGVAVVTIVLAAGVIVGLLVAREKRAFEASLTPADRVHIASLNRELETNPPPLGSLVVLREGLVGFVVRTESYDMVSFRWVGSKARDGVPKNPSNYKLYRIERIIRPDDAVAYVQTVRTYAERFF